MDEPLPIPPLQFPSSSIPRERGGYDRDATESVFETIASSYERLWLETSRLREQMSTIQTDLDDKERLLGQALVDAKRWAMSIKGDARREAGTAIKKARAKADELLAAAEREAHARAASEEEARAQAEEIVGKARGEAAEIVAQGEREAQARVEQMLAGAERERVRIEGEIERLHGFANETREELSSFLLAALKWQKRGLDESASGLETGAPELMLQAPAAVDDTGLEQADGETGNSSRPLGESPMAS